MTIINDSPSPAGSRPEPGATVEIIASDLLTNGQAVGRVDGNVIFVFGPLPGERARVRIIATKQRYLVAELIELLETSPDRVAPFCSVFGECGGCQLQHWKYESQLAWKRETVLQALKRIGGLADIAVLPTVGMDDPRAYRNKMSLVIGSHEMQGKLGFYAARSHDIVPIEECPIVLPALQADLQVLHEAIANPTTSEAFVDAKHVVIRRARSTGQGVMALTSAKVSNQLPATGALLRGRFENMVGLTNSFAPTGENVVIGRHQRLLSGQSTMEENIAGTRFRVSVQSFFQVNGAMVELIVDALKPQIRPNLHIVDLYCGAGTFAVIFAKLGATVFGLEENPAAVHEAIANAELNHVSDRAQFAVGRVEHAVREEGGRRELRNANVIFLDPPRKGSDEITLAAIVASGAEAVWYLSCNPATLARDAATLVQGGFEARFAQPFDMFPQTGHIEVLMCFQRYLERLL